MKLDYNTRTEWHYYTINTEKEKVNRYRRVKYNEIDFDVLMIEITANGRSHYFAIPASALPRETDSIHFTYYGPTDIRWSPVDINNSVEELDANVATQFSLRYNLPIPSNEPVYVPTFEDEDDIYKARKKTIRNWIIAIICVLSFLYFIGLSDSNSGLTQAGAQACVKLYLENNLDDPESYKSERWSDLTFNEHTNTYSITHTYRARNRFGGYVRNTLIFELDENGRIISLY